MGRPVLFLGKLIVGLAILSVGCDKDRKPVAPQTPAPTASPATAPLPKPVEAAPAPAPVPQTKARPATKSTPPPTVGKAVPSVSESRESSPYLTTSYVLQLEGRDCRNDGGAWTALIGAAMADAKRKALDQVLGDIKARTKNPELRKELLAAYTNATLDTRMLMMNQKPDPERGTCCVALCKVEIIPDPVRMGKLLKK